MSAILCDSLNGIDKIYQTYLKCKEIGLNPCILVPHSIKDEISTPLFNTFRQKIEVIFINSSKDIDPSLFNHKYIIITISDDEEYKFPSVFHHLHIESTRCILSIATPSGFHDTHIFTEFNNNLIRELLQLSIPTYMTEFNKNTFIWKGGNPSKESITFKRNTFPVEAISGVPTIIRVMPLTNWTTTDHLIKEWSRFCKGSNIVLTQQNPDYFLVINSTNQPVDPSKTIYFMMEPYGDNLFKEWLDKYPKLLFNGTHRHHLNNVEWHLSYSTTMLKNIEFSEERINGLCAIVSSRAYDPGQKYRLELVKILDSMKLPFQFDIYGKCSDMNFKNYKGELPRISKEQALNKYKYTLICENNDIPNYITEKLYDGILTETYTFYKGAPNTTSYFSPPSFGQLSGNIKDDLSLIIQSITSNKYQEALPSIKDMKKRILTQWALPVRINSILELTESIVLINYPSKEIEENLHKEHESLLMSQSFHHLARSVISIYNPKFIVDIAQTAIKENRGIVFVDHTKITPLLFQSISNLLHLTNVDIFTLNPAEEFGITYFRLKSCEKILFNHMNQRPLLEGMTKCIFTL
jgi:hypothetical protein